MKTSELIRLALIGAVNYEGSYIGSIQGCDNEETKEFIANSEKFIDECRKYYKKRYNEELVSVFD